MRKGPFCLDQVAIAVDTAKGRTSRKHLDQHITDTRQIGPQRKLTRLESFGGCISRRAGLDRWLAIQFAGRADIDQLGIAGPLEHDI